MLILLNYATIIALDDEVVDKTIHLKKSTKIKTPDAIITCTALVNNLTLITNNIADFKRIEGLKTFNPYEQ
jgi:predicted nucleic acid-binding protein